MSKSSKTVQVAVLVSGSGTNLQALITAKNLGKIPSAKLAAVISSNSKALAIEKAKLAGIKTFILDEKLAHVQKNYYEKHEDMMLEILQENEIQLIVLAGYLPIIGNKILDIYDERIINIHPSLIPAFCGKGYYGLAVHKAALKRGVAITGATVHFVNNEVDGGKIIMQKAVKVKKNDTAELLQKRVMEQAEWVLLPKAVEKICKKLIFTFN